MVLMVGLCLTACGKESKLKLTITQFADNGVAQICVNGIPNGTSTAEDFDTAITRQTGLLYSTYGSSTSAPYYETAEYNQGKWDVCVELNLKAGYNIGTLKIAVGNEVKEFSISTSAENRAMALMYGFSPSEDRYYAFFENISSDTQFKLIGQAEAQPIE